MATPNIDPIRAFLSGIGASNLDANGRPVGSTGGYVSLNNDQETELARLRGAPVTAAATTAPGYGGAPAASNAFDKLNKIYGTNFGSQPQPAGVAAVAGALPATTQMAGAIAQGADENKAMRIFQAMEAAGVVPQPGSMNYEQQLKAAKGIFDRMSAAPGAGGATPFGAFGVPSTSSSFQPGFRQDVIGAGGKEVAGYGGTLTSATPNAAGGTSFNLRQNPNTVPAGVAAAVRPATPAAVSPAAMKFLRDGIDPQVTPGGPQSTGVMANQAIPAQPQASAFDQAAGSYKQAVSDASGTDRYRRTGPMSTKDGQYIGDGVFDTKTGRSGLMGEDGQFKALPEGAEPITATGLQKSIPDQKQFRALKGELTDAEISLRNMDRYIKSVGGSAKGVDRMATQFITGMKTLTGQGLNPKEIATKMAQGEMQGLLGANRTNVVGGGVMTEADALRVIQRLGGDFDSLQNPEVVKRAIGEVYSDRYQQYQDSLKFYNGAVADFYGSRGFKPAEEVKFSESFKIGDAPAAANKPAGRLSPEQNTRLRELRAKRDAAKSN